MFGYYSPEKFINISGTLFTDFEEQISKFYNPEETAYMCFITDKQIIYSKGIMPYKGPEYFDVSTDLLELSDICLYEPFAAFKERKNVVVFPYLENVQIGYVNHHEIDEEQEMVNDFKLRLSTSKFTSTQMFLVDDDPAEWDAEKLGE